MRPILRWEVEVFLNKLSESAANYIDPNVAMMMLWAEKFKVDVTVNEARKILKAKGPHPDYITGRTPNRGNAMIWETDVEDPEDDEIPQAVIDSYEAAGWDTSTTPWTPPS